MSKKSKKNNRAKKVLGSFADLGNTGKNTISRLATTVKADMPTVLLGNKDPFAGTVKTDGLKGFGENGFSKLAKRLNPIRAVGGNMQYKPAAARLKHIAGKMGKAAVPKTRKSKGMIWIVLFLTALAGGGYYLWESSTGLGDKIVQIVDYKSWLNKTAGKVQSHESQKHTQSRTTIADRATKSQSYSSSHRATPKKVSSVKSKSISLKKSSAKKASSRSAKKAVAKQKIWKERLAKLKKRSQADYRKASTKYRNNHK